MPVGEIRVAVDVGSRAHRVAVGNAEGAVLEEFSIAHTAAGFRKFFHRLGEHERRWSQPVVVAMEGMNGWARPLDQQVLSRGYRLLNVNNVKLARYKEIFPGAAKSDQIDTRKMLELFQLQKSLPMAKQVLQEVAPTSCENQQLKRLSRRRRQLVNEKVGVINRLQSDLQAICPDLLAITKNSLNQWFLHLLTCRNDLRELSTLSRASLLKVSCVGSKYARLIQQWQSEAEFSEEVDWAGEMIIDDARRVLELIGKIKALDARMEKIAEGSSLACRIGTIPGFGKTTRAGLAGEIGNPVRFPNEGSLALYLGMASLDNSSGTYKGTKQPRQVNARAKAAMMIAVARHLTCVTESRIYYEKKRAEGKKHNQAIRALGRHLVRVLWSMIQQERDYVIRPIQKKTRKTA